MAHRGPLGIKALSVAILFAPIPSLSTDYEARSSNSEFACASATSSDRCFLFCDDTKGDVFAFDCGNAGECHFDCSSDQCLRAGTLSASQAGTLHFTSTGSSCAKQATIDLPANGNATLTAPVIATFDSFKDRVNIVAGANTQNVIVNCNGGAYDACKRLIVDARTAQYLEINVGAASTLNGGNVDLSADLPLADYTNTQWAAVRCPQNSAYTGPEAAPCVIDSSSGGDIVFLYVETANGTPRDVLFKRGTGLFQDVYIQCAAGIDGFPFGVSGSYDTGLCDASASPTRSPTKAPTTTAPTGSPSGHPSQSPTQSPSGIPSKTPTSSPSASPSSSPVADPSSSPSKSPTASPSADPSTAPSGNPSSAPSAAPSAPPTTEDDQGEDTGPLQIESMDDSTEYVILIAGIVLAVSALLCVLLAFGYKRYVKNKYDANKDNVVITIKSENNNKSMEMGSTSGGPYYGSSSDLKPAEMQGKERLHTMSTSEVHRTNSNNLSTMSSNPAVFDHKNSAFSSNSGVPSTLQEHDDDEKKDEDVAYNAPKVTDGGPDADIDLTESGDDSDDDVINNMHTVR